MRRFAPLAAAGLAGLALAVPTAAAQARWVKFQCQPPVSAIAPLGISIQDPAPRVAVRTPLCGWARSIARDYVHFIYENRPARRIRGFACATRRLGYEHWRVNCWLDWSRGRLHVKFDWGA